MSDSVKPLPFPLLDPSSRQPLERNGQHLQAGDRSYSVLSKGRIQIVDFQPLVSKDAGAYRDNMPSLEAAMRQPTGQPFPFMYKTLALPYFTSRLPASGAVLLDIGCTNCGVMHAIPGDHLRIGVDISALSLFEHTPNVLDSNVDHLWIADANKLPMPDKCADGILCNDILEHLIRPEQLIAELHRVLKPGGAIFVSVPNLVGLGNRLSYLIGNGTGFELAQLLKGRSPVIAISGPRFPDQDLHVRWFTSHSLTDFLEKHGFAVQTRFGIGPIASRLKLGRIAHNLSLLAGAVAIPAK